MDYKYDFRIDFRFELLNYFITFLYFSCYFLNFLNIMATETFYLI